jgi:hypothetical protein
VNSINFKTINLLLIAMLFFSSKSISQNTLAKTNNIMETIITSGNDATGTTGTVTYSIGQVFYTYIGESVYNLAQGIQHQAIKNNLSLPDDTIDLKVDVLIFPNPTTDFVNINMNGLLLENEKRSYQLYDIQGRLLKQNTINQNITQINLNGLTPSMYILRINVNNKALKTFKILKK